VEDQVDHNLLALRLHRRPPTGSALAIGRRTMSVIKLATSP
jgi:hypothetical protein